MAHRKIVAIVAAAASISFAASSFGATNPPFKAKKITYSLVRAYQLCSAANTTHNSPLELPACGPAVPTSQIVELGPRGTGQITLTVTGTPDIKLSANLMDIRNASDHTPFTGTLYITADFRLTDQNCQPDMNNDPDCTMIDSPGNLVPITCNASGTCRGSKTLNAYYGGPLVVGGKQANVNVISVGISDGSLDQNSIPINFLVPGLFVP